MSQEKENAKSPVEQPAAAPIDEPVAAWINYPVKTVDGEFAGYEKPELSFTRPAYGYDITMAEPLYRRAPAPAVAPIDIEARFIAEHGHRLAQLLRIDAFDIADRDAQIMAALKDEHAPTPADERAAFEAWWVSDVPVRYRSDTLRVLRQSRELDGKYGTGNIAHAWKGWQARAASANETQTCSHQWTWADGKCADCGMTAQQPHAESGMTLAERIAHVGGRITEGGYVEFGSAMAVDALIQHALRDARASANETGAEGATTEAATLLRQARDELCLVEWENDPSNRVQALFDRIEAYVSRTPAQAAEPAVEVVREYFAGRDHWDFKIFDRTLKHGAKLYAAPQPPAPASAPVGLTVYDLRIIEKLLVGSGYIGVLSRVRTLLEGAKHSTPGETS